MPRRIQEILLVSSAYDAFVLEEDGSLSDRLFRDFRGLDPSAVPRLTHVDNAAAAMQMLQDRRFDLVLTVVRVKDTGVVEFSRRVKDHYPELPLVLLTFDEADLAHFPGGVVPATVDRVFLWTGDTRTLTAAIMLIEDDLNVEHDTRSAGVQVILVVEDRVRAYSTFLAILYPALMEQAWSLVGEALNEAHKGMRMRARPKILLARSYDEGLALFHGFRPNILAVVSDIRFPQAGIDDPEAGLRLAKTIRDDAPELPILLQSTEAHEQAAAQLGAWFIDKTDPAFPERLSRFLRVGLGFGDFIFRMGDGVEVARARNIFEMQSVLATVPAESIEHHASRKDFSTWLKARSMFALAEQIRGRRIEEFNGIEDVRRFLIEVIRQARRQEQEGVIADFSPRHTGPQNRFVRVGRGSIGGKGRSVAFLSAQIVRHELLHRIPGLEIRIPKTVVLGTDAFDEFMSQFDLAQLLSSDDDEAILQRILDGALPSALIGDLRAAFDALRGPLAVRSSSLLEDSRFQPFAGVYATYMLPNNHPDPDVRFAELCRAIRGVYASSFSREARTYAASTPHFMESQKMAVVLMQVVGRDHGDRFYPHLSGVAQSYNYYPIGSQKAEDGVAVLALGLGETVVSGRTALRFSPGAPAILPQFPTARSMLRRTQTQFYVVDRSRPMLDVRAGPEASLSLHGLDAAEADGSLRSIGSVYCAEDDVIRDNLSLAGPRVVTFNNILKWNAVPLAPALLHLLGVLREALGGEVEFEFALDLGPFSGPNADRKVPRLYLLQVRPLASAEDQNLDIDLRTLTGDQVLARTERALGHGRIDGVVDIVYVHAEDIDGTRTPTIAAEVGELNAALRDEDRAYLLIGPGRWGTSDPSLGIPVEWGQIAGARVIIETAMNHRHVEHSQGTHFFQNVTARRIGYLTVAPEAAGTLDRAWLDAQPAARQTAHVRHVRLSTPLSVYLDGHKGHAVVLKQPRDRPDPID